MNRNVGLKIIPWQWYNVEKAVAGFIRSTKGNYVNYTVNLGYGVTNRPSSVKITTVFKDKFDCEVQGGFYIDVNNGEIPGLGFPTGQWDLASLSQ